MAACRLVTQMWSSLGYYQQKSISISFISKPSDNIFFLSANEKICLIVMPMIVSRKLISASKSLHQAWFGKWR